jgi:hypothetical protein
MSLSMYQASVPAFVQMLGALSSVLAKAEAFAAERKIDQAVLLNYRLAPDMFPLIRQIRIAADFGKSCPARLAGVEVPSYPDNETGFAELRARLGRTIAFAQSLEPEAIDGSEEREITITVGGQPMTFKGQDYLVHFVLPNFYFHTTAAYVILRHAGVPLGKRDYLGRT